MNKDKKCGLLILYFCSLVDRVQWDRTFFGVGARVVVLLGLGLRVLGVLRRTRIQVLFEDPCVPVVSLEHKVGDIAQKWDQAKLIVLHEPGGKGIVCVLRLENMWVQQLDKVKEHEIAEDYAFFLGLPQSQ